MEQDFIYSLRVSLEDLGIFNKAVILRDRVSLNDYEKPFATIMHYQTVTPKSPAAGRRLYEETYYFQVGIFAETYEDNLELANKAREHLRNEVPLYLYNETLDTFELTEDTFYVDVSNYSPLSNDELEDTTYDHHGYFEVSIHIIRDKGERAFVQ